MLQMDIAAWNQHPDDVDQALPYSRRGCPNLDGQQYNLAIQEARRNGGFVDAIQSGKLLLRLHGFVLTFTC